MENWNPLKEDFNDSNFNSYNKGPGRNLPKSDSVRSGVQLYVTGIPVNLKPEGLRNLFCQAGRVTHVKILPTKIPGSLDTFGFITMASVKEATDALTRFHGFQIDRFRLKVQPCQTPEEQNRRKRIKEQDEAFLSTLNCGKINPLAANKSSDDTDDEQTKKPSMNGVNKDEQLTEKLGKGRGRGAMINSQDISVLDQSIVSHGPPSSSINSSIDSLVDLTITVGNQHRQVCVDPDTVRRGSADAGRSSRMSYAGSECSYSGRGVQTNVFRGRGYNRFNSSSPQFIPGPSGDRLHHTIPQIQAPKSGKECLYCRKKAVMICTRCKMPYCSSACQTADWPKHKTSCSKISTMPKEIDVEDFEVSIGEDIVEYFPPKDREAIQQEYGDKIKTAYQKDQQVLEKTESIKPLKHSSPKKKKGNSPRKPSGPVVEAPLLSDLPKLDLELNKDISTIVTHIDSPDSFFVCLTEDIEKSFSVDEKLKTAMTTCIKGVPTYGQLFACNFAEMWCRCKVLSPSSPEQVKIAYLDFGNCETVPIQRLFPLPPTMVNFCALAIRCKIDGIVPVDSTVGWPNECLTRFLQPNTLCTIHIVKRERMLFFVKVKDANGNDVAKQLIKAKIAKTIGASKIMVKDVPKVIQSLTPEQKLQVFVVLATSPEDFIVQIDERSHRATLEAFTSELDKSCEMDKQPLYRPDVGELVSCKYEDGHWYRGDVIRVTNAAAVVYFIDFGNESEIPLSNIRPSLIEHAEYPAQAIQCSLHGIRDIRAQNEVKVDDCFSELSLKLCCRYQAQIKQIQDKIVVLDLYDKSDRLVTEILSKYVEKSSAPPKAPSKLQSEIEGEALKVGETFGAKLQSFISGTEFYILKMSRFQELGQLLREINEHCVKSTESYSPCVGEYVYALYLGDWYRAKVISVNNENISVYFVDYGNRHEDTSATIRKMLPEHLKLPGQAIKCCFDGVDRPLDKETTQTVEHILQNNPEFNVKVVSTANEACKIQVILAQGQCLNEAILSLNEENSAAQEESAISNKTLSEDRSDLSQNNVTIPRCVFPTDGSTVFCKLTFASDREFCVSNIENAKQEAKFFQEINQHCASSKQNYIPTLGEHVYALYEGFWFRARVLAVSETNFSVYFVDYGNSVAVKSAEIRQILPEHLELPCQAVKCFFDGIDSPFDDETKQVVEGFLQDPSNSPFKVKVVSKEKDVHKVRVILSDGQCLNDAVKVLCKDAKTAPDNQEDTVAKETPTVKSPVSTKILNVILPTDGSDITCIFRTFVSNSIFCISKAKDKPQEEKLLQEINQHCSSSTECHTPSVGEYVYAVFEGVWYRAKVLDTDNENYSVYYVDYGNSNKVTSARIRKILPEHLELPCQAVKCCFDGIDSPLDDDSKQTIEGILQDPAQPLFNVRAISIFNGVHRVRVTIQNGTCINDALIAMMEETTSLPTDTPQPAQPQETSPTSSQEQIVKSAEMARIANSTLPTDGSEIACIFTTFLSNSEFCVSKAEDKPQEGKLLQEINLHCTSSTEHYTPSVGEFVYAMFEGAWYRAEVLETDNLNFSVCFVDYGNYSTVKSDQIRKLVPKHVELPCQAMKCSFSGVDLPLDDEMRQVIEGLLQDPTQFPFNVQATSVSDNIHKVKIITKDGTNINDALIAMIVDPSQSDESPTLVSQEKTKAVALPDSVLPLDGTEIACTFTTFISNGEFGLSRLENKTLKIQLLQEINVHCASTTEHYTPAVEEFVYALFEGAWNRAKVLGANKEKFSVYFVDHGNSVDVSSAEIRKILPEHLELPCLVVKCCFDGIDAPLDEECRQLIGGIMQDQKQSPFNVRAASVVNNVYKVKIITKNGTCINDALMALMDETASSVADAQETKKQDGPPSLSSQDNAGKSTDMNTIPNSVLPTDGSEIDCTFITFLSNSEFCVLKAEDKPYEVKLFQEINQHCSASSEHYSPSAGEFIYAMFEGDWYRAKVLATDNGIFSVYFVDYGNSNKVTSAQIRKLMPEHLELPCQAVKCCFDGVQAPLDDKTRQTIVNVLQDPNESPFKVQVVSLMNDVHKVRIVISDGQCLNDVLKAIGTKKAETHEEAYDIPKGITDAPLSPKDSKEKHTIADKLQETFKTINIPECDTPVDVTTDVTCLFTTFISDKVFCVSLFKNLSLSLHLHKEIKDHCSEITQSYSPCEGENVYALYLGDWYRAKVLSVKDDNVSVYFVDYGNCIEVTSAEIRKILPNHLELPSQAIKCTLDGFSKSFDNKSKQSVESLLCQGQFNVRFMSKEKDVYRVRITLNNGSCLSSILDKDISSKEPKSTNTKELPRLDYPTDGSSFEAMFTSRISESTFCILKVEEVNNLSHVMQQVTSHCTTSHKVYKGSVGDYVCAKFESDGIWYRAKINNVMYDKYEVLFIDYGNVDNVSLENIREMMQELRSYPAQAILCSLAGVKEIKSKTFDQEMAAQTLFVEVLSVTDGINEVKVVLEDGTCVNDNYTEQTLPPSPSNDPSMTLPNVTPSCFKQLASPSNDPTMTLSKDNPVEFEIQHIDSMTDFYIHVAHENVKKAVRRIEEELQELCKGTDVYNPVVGEYVCCLFEGLWYRALVLNVVNQLYTVKLVDYGNTTDIPLECIRKFNTELASLHPIACRCCLDNITQDDLVKFAEFLSTDHNTKIKLVSTEKDMNMVEIILSDGSSLNEKFRSPVTESVSSNIRSPVTEQTSSPVNSPASVVQDRARFTLNDISFIVPGDSELRAIFTAVTDPDNIYCHSATDAGAEAMSLLTQLSSKIADYCEKSVMDIEPRVNELYCGKQVDDWYRCLVIKLLSNQKVLVRYIDIGEEAEIPISDLRPFLPEFLSLPVTVFNCAVSGVKPIGEKWGTGAARLINSYGGETNTLRVVRREGDRLICDVITSRGVNIKKELIQQCLGVEAEEEETNVEDDEEAIIRRQIAELQAKLASKSKSQKS